MAGTAKPNIPNLGKEGQINLISYDDKNTYDTLNTLIDGSISSHRHAIGVALFDVSPEIVFELLQNSNIYAYGVHYQDSGGSTPKPLHLYKLINGVYELIDNNIQTKDNQWYLLKDKLGKGTYKLQYTARYTSFTEWYIEAISGSLLIQDGNNICKSDDGETILTIDTLPYTIEKFNNYGILDLSNINPTVISKLVNNKFNIAILK